MHYTQNMENSYFNSTFVYNAIYSFVPSANSNAILMTTIQIYKSARFVNLYINISNQHVSDKVLVGAVVVVIM